MNIFFLFSYIILIIEYFKNNSVNKYVYKIKNFTFTFKFNFGNYQLIALII